MLFGMNFKKKLTACVFMLCAGILVTAGDGIPLPVAQQVPQPVIATPIPDLVDSEQSGASMIAPSEELLHAGQAVIASCKQLRKKIWILSNLILTLRAANRLFKETTFQSMEDNIQKAIADNPDQQETFKAMFSQIKINTTGYRLGTWLLLGMMWAGVIIDYPESVTISVLASLIEGLYASSVFKKVQSFNQKCLDEAVTEINQQRMLDKQPAILPYARLSPLQKILGVTK